MQAGPLEYSRVFFLDRADEWDKPQLLQLRSALQEFLRACKIGMDKHESMCESDNDSAFQANLIQGYLDTETKMEEHFTKYQASL